MGVGSLSLLQGIFPTQESNQGLLHYRWILYQLSCEGSPKYDEKIAPYISIYNSDCCCSCCVPSVVSDSLQEILQARILEWVAMPASRGSSPPRHQTWVSCTAGGFFTSLKGSPRILEWVAYPFSSGSSCPRNRTRVSCITGRFFTS